MKKTFHGLGTIRHKKGRLKPFEFYSKGYYTEQGQYKQDFIKSFTTLKEAELFRLEYYNNNTDKKIEPTFLEVARLFGRVRTRQKSKYNAKFKKILE